MSIIPGTFRPCLEFTFNKYDFEHLDIAKFEYFYYQFLVHSSTLNSDRLLEIVNFSNI